MDTQFAIQFPIIKAVTHDDGTMEFEGIASDEGLDLENEIVKASGWTDSLGYLTQKGRVGWNHAKVRIGDKVSNVPIGDVVEAKIVSPAWISDHFGELTAAPIGHGVYVRGMLYKPNEDMLPDQERALMLARGTLAGGGSLGISLEGARVGSTADPEGITHTPRAVCHTAELTPSPMNGRTFAIPVRLAKSLSEALSGEGELTEPAVFICKGYGAADAAPGIMPSGYVRLLSADVRDALAAEQEATIQYEAAAAKAGHPLVREVLLRVAEEERVHAGEFQRLLETLLADEAALNAKGAAEVDEMTGRLTGKEMAKALRQVVEEAREAAVTDPVEDAGAESGGVLRDMAKALAGTVELLKGYVKPHTRKTKSGKVVQVGGYNTSRQVRADSSREELSNAVHRFQAAHPARRKMTQTTVELPYFLRAVAQDAIANETVRAAAAQGPEALEACLLPMLPVLMHERLRRDAVHAMSVLKRMEPNYYNATGLNEDSIATALMQDVYREIRQA